jgi:hypothetical protein
MIVRSLSSNTPSVNLNRLHVNVLSSSKGNILSLPKGNVLSLSKGNVLSLSKGNVRRAAMSLHPPRRASHAAQRHRVPGLGKHDIAHLGPWDNCVRLRPVDQDDAHRGLRVGALIHLNLTPAIMGTLETYEKVCAEKEYRG